MSYTRRGFTLVELMMVVALIGILAAISIPNYTRMYLRARRSEAMLNVTGIAHAQMAYEAMHDSFLTCADNPGTTGKQPQPWQTDEDWSKLSWAPDGDVRCSYSTNPIDNGGYQVEATCDVDGDGDPAIIRHDSTLKQTTDLYPEKY